VAAVKNSRTVVRGSRYIFHNGATAHKLQEKSPIAEDTRQSKFEVFISLSYYEATAMLMITTPVTPIIPD